MLKLPEGLPRRTKVYLDILDLEALTTAADMAVAAKMKEVLALLGKRYCLTPLKEHMTGGAMCRELFVSKERIPNLPGIKKQHWGNLMIWTNEISKKDFVLTIHLTGSTVDSYLSQHKCLAKFYRVLEMIAALDVSRLVDQMIMRIEKEIPRHLHDDTPKDWYPTIRHEQ